MVRKFDLLKCKTKSWNVEQYCSEGHVKAEEIEYLFMGMGKPATDKIQRSKPFMEYVFKDAGRIVLVTLLSHYDFFTSNNNPSTDAELRMTARYLELLKQSVSPLSKTRKDSPIPPYDVLLPIVPKLVKLVKRFQLKKREEYVWGAPQGRIYSIAIQLIEGIGRHDKDVYTKIYGHKDWLLDKDGGEVMTPARVRNWEYMQDVTYNKNFDRKLENIRRTRTYEGFNPERYTESELPEKTLTPNANIDWIEEKLRIFRLVSGDIGTYDIAKLYKTLDREGEITQSTDGYCFRKLPQRINNLHIRGAVWR